MAGKSKKKYTQVEDSDVDSSGKFSYILILKSPKLNLFSPKHVITEKSFNSNVIDDDDAHSISETEQFFFGKSN